MKGLEVSRAGPMNDAINDLDCFAAEGFGVVAVWSAEGFGGVMVIFVIKRPHSTSKVLSSGVI